jgi:hypothetical protein
MADELTIEQQKALALAEAQLKLSQGNETTQETPFQAFVRGLKSPVLPQNKTAVVGPAIAGAVGETIKGIGGATQLVSPQAGQPLVDVGKAMIQGSAQNYPIQTGLGQIGAYVAPTMAGQKGLTAAHQALGLAPGAGLKAAEGAILGGGINLLTTPTEEGRATSGALGTVIGAASPIAGSVIGKTLSPVLRPEVEKLTKEGVSLTPGQILGGFLRKQEEKATSLPVIGEVIQKAREKGIEQFNKAAYKRALDPIEGTVPEVVGRQGIDAVKTQISKAYDDLLPKLTFVPDNGLAQNLETLDKTVRGLPKKDAEYVKDTVTSIIKDRMPENGLIDGATFKIIESDVSKLAKKYAGSSGTEGLMGDAYAQSLKAIRENLARSNPEYANELKRVNTAFANYSIIREAGSKANTAEKFTPAQLAAAVRKSDESAGKGKYATGKALMQDLTDAGQLILPSTIPDSGTAGRSAVTNLTNWVIGTGATIPYVAGGKLITNPPKTAKQIGELLRQNPEIMSGLGLGVQRKLGE